MPDACPVRHDFDPLRSDVVVDFPALARAREETPVFYMPQLDSWCVTRYEDALALLRHDDVRISRPGAADPLPPAIAAEVGADHPMPLTEENLAFSDPPQHTRLRKILQPHFTPKAVARHAGVIAQLVDGAIDTFPQDGSFDLMERFASPLPIGVVGAILGLPQEMLGGFREYVEVVQQTMNTPGLPEAEREAHWRVILDFDRRLRAFLEERRARPADDLTSDLLRAADANGTPLLSDSEIFHNMVGLALAGGDTTAILICHMVHELLAEPERWASLRATPERVPEAVEETLRLRGVVMSLRRRTVADVEVGGVTIPEGSRIHINVMSCNRDAHVFADADAFAPGRAGLSRHLGWGRWTHMCIGMPLARLEARIALERLLERLPAPRLADPDAGLEYRPSANFPLLRRLEIVSTSGRRVSPPAS